MAEPAGSWAIAKLWWPHDRPAEAGQRDEPFFRFVIRHFMAQHDAAEQRPRLPAAVADTQEGLIDEPGWTGALHRLDDEADAANHRCIVLQRSTDAETAQHRVVPGD